jgi:hypothetical protein
MRIEFDLPDSVARLLRLSAERMHLAYPGRRGELTESDIAKSLVQECLIDDAEAHGIVMLSLFEGRAN